MEYGDGARPPVLDNLDWNPFILADLFYTKEIWLLKVMVEAMQKRPAISEPLKPLLAP